MLHHATLSLQPASVVADKTPFGSAHHCSSAPVARPQRRLAKHTSLVNPATRSVKRTVAKRRSRSFSDLESIQEHEPMRFTAPEDDACETAPNRRRRRSLIVTPSVTIYMLPAASVSAYVLGTPRRRRVPGDEKIGREALRRRAKFTSLRSAAVSPAPTQVGSPLKSAIAEVASGPSSSPKPSPPLRYARELALPRLEPDLERQTYVVSYRKLLLRKSIRVRVPIANLMGHIRVVQPTVHWTTQESLAATLATVGNNTHPGSINTSMNARRRNRQRLNRISQNLSYKDPSPLRAEWRPEDDALADSTHLSKYSRRVEDVTRDAAAKAELAVRKMSMDSLKGIPSSPSPAMSPLRATLGHRASLPAMKLNERHSESSHSMFSKPILSRLRPLSASSFASTDFSSSSAHQSASKPAWRKNPWKGIKRALSCSMLSLRPWKSKAAEREQYLQEEQQQSGPHFVLSTLVGGPPSPPARASTESFWRPVIV
ncbi:hypothetical protein HDU87_000407 [Geranomyces variabilis]|uniref:Uncharacterized protein n=1 Tax=Geranomyces variabilis TaxID=109894 RepID=A0AAD5TNM2_9FUNG|nr:hypothetical protein HDU87_000407 [Geranomyces variabilis]